MHRILKFNFQICPYFFINFTEEIPLVSVYLFVIARKRSLRRLCFYRCLSVNRGGGGMRGCGGGVRGCRGCVWLPGGVLGCRGCAWLWGVCMVARGGACVVAGVCIGYDEIRSMSGRYASYWNAFLFKHLITL